MFKWKYPLWYSRDIKMEDCILFLCNPHNSTGTIWTREEQGRIGQLCAANHGTVISDKIHCDLT